MIDKYYAATTTAFRSEILAQSLSDGREETTHIQKMYTPRVKADRDFYLNNYIKQTKKEQAKRSVRPLCFGAHTYTHVLCRD